MTEDNMPLPGPERVAAQVAAADGKYGGLAIAFSYAKGIPRREAGAIIVYVWDGNTLIHARVPVQELQEALDEYHRVFNVDHNGTDS